MGFWVQTGNGGRFVVDSTFSSLPGPLLVSLCSLILCSLLIGGHLMDGKGSRVMEQLGDDWGEGPREREKGRDDNRLARPLRCQYLISFSAKNK